MSAGAFQFKMPPISSASRSRSSKVIFTTVDLWSMSVNATGVVCSTAQPKGKVNKPTSVYRSAMVCPVFAQSDAYLPADCQRGLYASRLCRCCNWRSTIEQKRWMNVWGIQLGQHGWWGMVYHAGKRFAWAGPIQRIESKRCSEILFDLPDSLLSELCEMISYCLSMFAAWCLVLDAWSFVLDAWCLMFVGWRLMLDAGCLMMLDAWWRLVLDAWCLMLYAWCMMRDAWCLMLDPWCLMVDAWCLMLGPRCLVRDARCLMLVAWCMLDGSWTQNWPKARVRTGPPHAMTHQTPVDTS